MISPIIVAQASQPSAMIQHNNDSQASLLNSNAFVNSKEEERQLNETVVKKDEAVLYEQNHDAKEEGKNKYENLYKKKKEKKQTESANSGAAIKRVSFDVKI